MNQVVGGRIPQVGDTLWYYEHGNPESPPRHAVVTEGNKETPFTPRIAVLYPGAVTYNHVEHNVPFISDPSEACDKNRLGGWDWPGIGQQVSVTAEVAEPPSDDPPPTE